MQNSAFVEPGRSISYRLVRVFEGSERGFKLLDLPENRKSFWWGNPLFMRHTIPYEVLFQAVGNAF